MSGQQHCSLFHIKGIVMNKTLQILVVLTVCLITSACANLDNNNLGQNLSHNLGNNSNQDLDKKSDKNLDKAETNASAQWDFDHQVQFIQTKLTKNSYQLEIIPSSKVNFERLATFLLRKYYRICQHYHYKLEIVQGIEGFDDRFAMPNYIFPSLIAKVEC